MKHDTSGEKLPLLKINSPKAEFSNCNSKLDNLIFNKKSMKMSTEILT